jgi:hypothetical protein
MTETLWPKKNSRKLRCFNARNAVARRESVGIVDWMLTTFETVLATSRMAAI